jgi:glycosyltransferase involved in cell wall biosynthesis
MPHVSVVIPVFNSAATIGTALRSVFAQTFTDFEVIVVDDGSEDGDELDRALSEWGGRILYLRQTNGGPARARNAGIARASGRLIAFLDADDEWLPEKLALQVGYFDRYPATGLLHTAVVDDPLRGRAEDRPPRHAFCDLFHTTFFINTLTVMIPRSVLEDVGGFDERREIHIEDWDLWLRIAGRHTLGYLSRPLARHRPGGHMSRQIERTYAAQALVIDKNLHLCTLACPRHAAAPERCLGARRHVLYRDWGYDRLVAGDIAGAREHLAHALAYAPWSPRTGALYLSTHIGDRWRTRARRIKRDSTRLGSRPAASAPRVRPVPHDSTPVSLVHDTAARRLRRRAIARLHDLDDAVSRSGRARRRVLFEAASPMSLAIFRSVYERLRHDPRIDLWFTSYGDVWQPRDIFSPAGITDNVVPAATAAWMKVDAYVNADFWDMTWLHRRTRRIHLFHGVAGKYRLDAPLELAPTIAAFDCLMFVNGDRQRRYIEAGLVPSDGLKAALVGYPKIDCLVNGSLERAVVARELGFDPAVPVVIYAPTWSPYASLNVMGEAIIERLAAEGLQVIVKLHDRSYDRRHRGSGGIDWSSRLSRYRTHPLVRVVREADGSPFLVAADALVSDHSSIAFEYMLLDRPIVVVDRRELVRQASINPDKVRSLHAASDVALDPRDVVSKVSAALLAPDRLSAARRETARSLFYRPGTATDRAVSLIYQLMELPALANAAPPLESGHTLATVG